MPTGAPYVPTKCAQKQKQIKNQKQNKTQQQKKRPGRLHNAAHTPRKMFVRAAAFGLLALSLAAVVKANVEVLDDESFTALVEVRFFQDAQSALAGLPPRPRRRQFPLLAISVSSCEHDSAANVFFFFFSSAVCTKLLCARALPRSLFLAAHRSPASRRWSSSTHPVS